MSDRNSVEISNELTPEDEYSIDDIEILVSFIAESTAQLENIGVKIIALENNSNFEILNEIYRTMHTIKGIASFLGLSKIKDLSHNLENILGDLRNEKILISPDLVDLVLEGIHTLNRIMSDLGTWAEDFTGGGIIKGFSTNVEIQEIVEDIKHWCNL